MYKIIIIDDHTLLRDMLVDTINNESNFEVVGVASDAKDSINLCENFKPDIVLMDVCTENHSNGISYAKLIKENFSNIKIVIMTGVLDINFVNQAKASKVDSFIYKNISKVSLISVLNNTLDGYSMYPDTNALKINHEKNILVNLTNRELEILTLYCKLLSRTEVAESIGISERTLKTHIASIYEKTGFNDLAKLSIYCVGNGLIVPNLEDA